VLAEEDGDLLGELRVLVSFRHGQLTESSMSGLHGSPRHATRLAARTTPARAWKSSKPNTPRDAD
jgi:hypothetical protein